MSDEGFHEIQLGGKQLVFLFMTAAVVGVVLFLSGVMVGRGVRNEKAATSAGAPAPVASELAAVSTEPVAVTPGAPRGGQPAGDQAPLRPATPPVTPPAPVADDAPRPAAAESPKPEVKASKPTAPATKPEPTAKTPASAGDAATGTYAVQVSAPKDRPSAEAIAKRLVGKGYAAYVVGPTPGSTAPIYYKVRVGPFKSRREADEVRRRLEKEEQFKPFITR